MGKYSIKDLEQLSGIKAHTLRIWEKRYNLMSPSRTATNIRYYSDLDLKKLLNVATLYNQGFKISRIANLSSHEINNSITDVSVSSTNAINEVYIDQLIISMVDLNEIKFHSLIAEFTEKQGFENTVVNVLYPLLIKIGVLWQTGNIHPAHEHFISSLIRQKIIAATDSLNTLGTERGVALLFLQENELHELGLLFANYICKKNGFKTFYLGQSVPFDDLVRVSRKCNPDILITYFIAQQKKATLEGFLNKISAEFQKQKILIAGNALKHFNTTTGLPENVKHFNNTNQLISELESIF